MGNELYMRWVQFGMMNPLSTFFSSAGNETSNMPYNFSKQAQDNFRTYSHLKSKLFPYIYTYAHLTRLIGTKMVQGTAEYPNQYLYGNELLVAPVYIQGATSRTLYLPEGDWVHFWTKEDYKGEQELTVNAPVDELPLFARKGAVIPMREYSRTIEGGNANLELHVFAGADGDFDLYEDDGISNGYKTGEIAKTRFIWDDTNARLTVKATEGSYTGMPTSRNIKVFIHQNKTVRELAAQLFNGKSDLQFVLE